MFTPVRYVVVVAACWVLPQSARAHTVAGEIHELLLRVPGVTLIQLPVSGTVTLSADSALTADKARNVVLDDDAPVSVPYHYPANGGDGAAEGSEPYIADGIAPFRLKYFTTEWHYAGWYTMAMADYALMHGFRVTTTYGRTPADVPVANSQSREQLNLSWDSWMSTHGYTPGRYDQLPSRDCLVNTLLSEDQFARAAGSPTHLLLDMEDPPGGPPSEAALRNSSWYPPGGVNPQFEDDYYNGYVSTQLAAVEAATKEGWKDVGLYIWAPFPRTVSPQLGTTLTLDPNSYFPWVRYGREIYRDARLDVIYPSVYNFYWHDSNVAYVLANIDLNMQLIHSEPIEKPLRPYFWNKLHGGGDGWRWWAEQPVRNEDMRAEIGMNFFTDADGLVLWSWSDFSNHHLATVASCKDYTLADGFIVLDEITGAPRQMLRYDAIHVLDVNAAGVARFQVINKAGNASNDFGTNRPKVPSAPPGGQSHRCWSNGDPLTFPVYSLPVATLASHLRPVSEPVAQVIEALAMVRLLEYTLWTGTTAIDVPAQQQFAQLSPIIRRVANGAYSIVATYDPQWQQFPEGRTITLHDFAARPGLTVTFPADRELRFYIMRTE